MTVEKTETSCIAIYMVPEVPQDPPGLVLERKVVTLIAKLLMNSGKMVGRLARGQQAFSLKGGVNILGFVVHMVWIETTVPFLKDRSSHRQFINK